MTVLFFHGNAGNISHRMEKLALFRELGADVLIVDYRGYGSSTGRPGERGLYLDARAAYRHLIDERRVSPNALLLYGESLGTAVVVDLAAEVEVGALVLESGFTSIPDVAQAMYPVLPVRWIVRNRFDTLSKIRRVRAPILILHSRDDEFFPIHHAERLAAAAAPRARLVELRGGHNDAFQVSERVYREALRELLAATARSAESSTMISDRDDVRILGGDHRVLEPPLGTRALLGRRRLVRQLACRERAGAVEGDREPRALVPFQ